MISIDVTQEDIDNGLRRACSNCPIALAASRVYKEPLQVGLFLIHFIDRSIKLPPAAIQFIIDFDNDRPVQPFTFTLGD